MAAAERCHLPFAADYLERCAARIVEAVAALLPDLSACLVVIPNPALAPALRTALARTAGRSLLLPRIATLSQLAAPGLAAGGVPADSARQFHLYRELKERGWFSEAALWELCGELIELFDELTERAVGLAGDEAALLERLGRAYAVGASQPLRFEAQVVHSLWRAEATGSPGRRAAAAMALARMAESATGPLFDLCEVEPAPLEAAFCDAWAARQPGTVIMPCREGQVSPLLQLLDLAWPAAAGDAAPLAERADRARSALSRSPLAGRLRLIGSASLEEEAQTVAAEVRRWLADGKRRIALVAADRVAARRARALLERDAILVADETGWRLSTTRAAALVDAWLEVLASDAYHRDLLDLVKSPFVFADLPAPQRQAAVHQLESGLVRHNLACGLRRYEAALVHEGQSEAALGLLRRVGLARERMPLAAARPGEWLERLEAALDALGALPALAADAAGQALLELLRARRGELADSALRLAFGEWRTWLDGELERAAFVDRGIDSPVVMTHLTATRLRAFDAAVIIGADREHLAPVLSRAVFSSQAVRAELGLPTYAEASAHLRDDLAYLLAGCAEVTASWQAQRRDEPNLLCADLASLSLLHRRAYGDGLAAAPAAAEGHGPRAGAGTPMPAPVAPRDRLPLRLPVSAYASLVACPYQFYMRRVLGLAEGEEVREALEKRDYGEHVHRILQRFHGHYPTLGAYGDADLAGALAAISREEFAPVLEESFLDHAWLARWLARVPSYLAWQRQREADGWRPAGSELARERALPLPDSAELVLHGRLDRLDCNGAGTEAVLDYKAQRQPALRSRAADADDVQLAAYVLLQGAAVCEAAYVALDDERIGEVALGEPQEVARRQGERLAASYARLRDGAGLPAHGADAVCAWCEGRGLCRKDYHAQVAGGSEA